jgi:hypothetical protein
MRWRHKSNPCAGRKFIRAQPLTLHRYREQTGAGGTQNFSRALITWFFNDDGLAVLDKYPNDQIQSLLRAVHHHHLRWVTIYGSRSPQMVADRFPQAGISG